jgi:hypothetical protein
MTEQRQPLQPANDGEDQDQDFAEEHDMTWVDADRQDERETESPHGHAGLEPTKRPD